VIKKGMVICEPLCDAIGADAFTKVAEEPLYCTHGVGNRAQAGVGNTAQLMMCRQSCIIDDVSAIVHNW
jgi:hypothetical protein